MKIYIPIIINLLQTMKDKMNLSRGRDRDNTARQVCKN